MKNLRTALLLILLSIVTLGISASETPKSNGSEKIDEAAVKRITKIVSSYLINSNATENTCKVVILFTVDNNSLINFVNVIGDDPEIACRLKDNLEKYNIKYNKGTKKDMVYILPVTMYLK